MDATEPTTSSKTSSLDQSDTHGISLSTAPVLLDACGTAWREALYSEYRGHARLVAQFVVVSQALQGLAQAAGELVPRDLPDSAWWSCVASSASQLGVMALCTVVLLWTQPYRARQHLVAEILPTVLQTGICASVLLLAAWRWAPNEMIVAGLDAAVGASAMLQPLIGIAVGLYEVVSEMDFAAIRDSLRRRYICRDGEWKVMMTLFVWSHETPGLKRRLAPGPSAPSLAGSDAAP
jgi:hypothetical protein